MDGYAMTPLEGGWSGETFLAESFGERTVVRIYARRGAERGPAAVEVDAAVLRLVRGLLPVPEVVEVRRPDASTGAPAVLVTSFLPGERLDVARSSMTPEALATAGDRLGGVLARLAQMPLLTSGAFIDGSLAVAPWPGPADLGGFAESLRTDSALAAWTEADFAALSRMADRAQTLLDLVDRVCLVHSDVNPKNVLVDPSTGEVTGLVDWEFAHAGSPVTDLGNLLRFDRDPPLADAAVAAYSRLVPDAGDDLLDRARAADLCSLVELASRRGQNPVADRAHDQLLAIARTGDLHATR